MFSSSSLTGMLSKAKGQILQVATVLHILFDPEPLQDISLVVSDAAIVAAINFVDTCCQHCAYIAGRGDITEEIKQLSSGMELQHKMYSKSETCIT